MTEVMVTPSRLAFPAHSSGIVPLHVTALSPGTASLSLKILSRLGQSFMGAVGPQVVADKSNWHFEQQKP
jgi:hypothetical protein